MLNLLLLAVLLRARPGGERGTIVGSFQKTAHSIADFFASLPHFPSLEGAIIAAVSRAAPSKR
jgi:hypothetical protein